MKIEFLGTLSVSLDSVDRVIAYQQFLIGGDDLIDKIRACIRYIYSNRKSGLAKIEEISGLESYFRSIWIGSDIFFSEHLALGMDWGEIYKKCENGIWQLNFEFSKEKKYKNPIFQINFREE